LHATELHVNLRGIRLMAGAMACFVINDMLVKIVSQHLPAAQLIFLRGLMASVLILAIARISGTPLRRTELTQPSVMLRAAIDGIASIFYLVSLFHLPIANATAINMASPLFIALFAVLLLGERIDTRRALAIGAGFVGVLMVIQPRAEGFNAFSLLCLLATFLHSVRDLATRRIAPGIASLAITLSTAVAVSLMAGGLSVFQGWQTPGAFDLGMLAGASVFLSAGYLMIIASTRSGDLSVVAPFRYTGLLCALVLGWLVWGDMPNALAWLGIALLLAAGLYLLGRERERARRVAAGESATGR